MPAIRDDDVREGVGGRRDIGHDLLVRGVRQGQLEQPDGFATIGHRHDQHRTVAGLAHVHLLSTQHLLIHGAGQLHRHRILSALELNHRHARSEFAETHDGTATEIGDQETHRLRSDHRGQLIRDHLDRVDG